MIDTYRCKAGVHGVSDPSVKRKQESDQFHRRSPLQIHSGSGFLRIFGHQFRGVQRASPAGPGLGHMGGQREGRPQNTKATALPSMQRFHHGKIQPNVCVRGMRRDVYLLSTESETPDVHLKRERDHVIRFSGLVVMNFISAHCVSGSFWFAIVSYRIRRHFLSHHRTRSTSHKYIIHTYSLHIEYFFKMEIYGAFLKQKNK